MELMIATGCCHRGSSRGRWPPPTAARHLLLPPSGLSPWLSSAVYPLMVWSTARYCSLLYHRRDRYCFQISCSPSPSPSSSLSLSLFSQLASVFATNDFFLSNRRPRILLHCTALADCVSFSKLSSNDLQSCIAFLLADRVSFPKLNHRIIKPRCSLTHLEQSFKKKEKRLRQSSPGTSPPTNEEPKKNATNPKCTAVIPRLVPEYFVVTDRQQ